MGTRGSWIEVGRGSEVASAIVYFLLGLAVWTAGLAMRTTRWNEFAGLHETCGLWLASGSLYWLGFTRHFVRWSRPEETLWEQPAALLVSTGLLVGAVFWGWRSARRELKKLLPWMALAMLPVVALAAGVDLHDGGWLLSGAAWITLFALSVAVIRTGLETGSEGWVNLGILFIAVNIVTRYFDLFGTMLEGGVFFIMTGALVIALGIFLEKKRRALIDGIRTEERA